MSILVSNPMVHYSEMNPQDQNTTRAIRTPEVHIEPITYGELDLLPVLSPIVEGL